MTTSRFWLPSLLFLLVAAACGDGDAGSPGPDPEPTTPAQTSPVTTSPVRTSPVGSDVDALAGTSWIAVRITDDLGDRVIVAGSEPTLDFGADGTTLSGSTGCNSYSGNVTIGSGTIAVRAVAVTERACLDAGVMDHESLFLQVLTSADSLMLVDGVLALQAPAGTLLLDAPAPVVDVSLDDTLWRLDTMSDGIAATSVIATTQPTMTIDLDGQTIRGTTGCNDYSGNALVEGGRITISELLVTEVACEQGIMRQEGRILEVLQSAERFEIDGDRLSIFGADGRALGYRAG